jgi:hypothetical protein
VGYESRSKKKKRKKKKQQQKKGGETKQRGRDALKHFFFFLDSEILDHELSIRPNGKFFHECGNLPNI